MIALEKQPTAKPRIFLERGIWLDIEEFSLALDSAIQDDIKRIASNSPANNNRNRYRSLGGGLWLDVDDFIGDLERNIQRYAQNQSVNAQRTGEIFPQELPILVQGLQKKIMEYNFRKMNKEKEIQQEVMTPNEMFARLVKTFPNLPQNPLSETFQKLVADLEPIEPATAIKHVLGQESLSPETLNLLKNISGIRRFRADPSPVYLMLGCSLLENLIEYDNGMVILEIKNALKVMQNHALVPFEQQSMYKQVELEYDNLIGFIQKEIQTNNFSDISKEKTLLLRKIYEAILAKPVCATTVGALGRAVFVSHSLNKADKNGQKTMNDEILTQTTHLPDSYLKKICQSFANLFSFRVNLFEFDSNPFGGELVQRSVFYPILGNKEFAFEVVFFSINGKKMSIKGISYSIDDWSEVKAQSIPAKVDMDLELLPCSVCAAPVDKKDVYKNYRCAHVYCRYCLEDHLCKTKTVCLVDLCFEQLDSQQIRMFLDKYPKQNSSKKSEIKIVDESNDCIICTLQIPKDGKSVRTLPCAHCFHQTCIVNWLKKDKSCPICRLEFKDLPHY